MTLAQTTLLQSVTKANVTFIDHFPLFGAERVGHENKECLRSHVIYGRGEAEAVKHAI